jgi:hypothetical protein
VKTEHEYYADSQPRYFKDHKNRAYDRAYKWDFAGRLEEAYLGYEAATFAGKPHNYNDGPYRQSYSHDTFGRMISRTNRFWGKNVGLTVSYNPVTGQTQNTVDIDLGNGQQTTGPTWQYDAAGKVTQDNNLKYFYNAAGLNWQAQDLMNVPKVTQEYDGDGRAVKRTGGVGGYYLNSSVLGVPVMELHSANIKDFMNVYLGTTRIAQLRDGTSFTNPPDKWVIWDHINPVVGSNGRSTEESWYYREAEPDSMGVNVGFDDPYAPPDPQPDADAETGIPKLQAGYQETGKRCSLDGITVDCGFVAHYLESEIGSGAIVQAPHKNLVPVYTKTTNQFLGYAFFDSNLGGYPLHYLEWGKIDSDLRITIPGYGVDETSDAEWGWIYKTKVIGTETVDVMSSELVFGQHAPKRLPLTPLSSTLSISDL